MYDDKFLMNYNNYMRIKRILTWVMIEIND
jgi:hypothetical protein